MVFVVLLERSAMSVKGKANLWCLVVFLGFALNSLPVDSACSCYGDASNPGAGGNITIRDVAVCTRRFRKLRSYYVKLAT